MAAKIQLKVVFIIFITIVGLCCGQAFTPNRSTINQTLINPSGNSLETRIEVPEGYTRINADSISFAVYLRKLKLKPDGSKVLLFNGAEKPMDVHAAVVDIDCGTSDLQQCADACIRLRSEYLWQTKQFDKINFNLTNGFEMPYSKWRSGHRLVVKGNTTSWQKSANTDDSYKTFRNYLNKVFTYAGTISVEKQLNKIALKDLMPGDVFVIGGSPGHAAMVADVATNAQGEKIFLLAQGYMPAQDIHIIKNPNSDALSPWFSLAPNEELKTLEWTFNSYTLGRF
jgi:hypothetical protein